MIHLLTVEESVGLFKDRLTLMGEVIPDVKSICDLIQLATIDAKQVLLNIEPREVEEILDDASPSHIGRLGLSDPFEEFHFNLVEEMINGYIRSQGEVTLLDISEIIVTNPKLVRVVTF